MSFLEMFKDEAGKVSSNRVLGTVGWAIGIVLALLGRNAEASTVLAASGALLGVGQVKSAVISSFSHTQTTAATSVVLQKQEIQKEEK